MSYLILILVVGQVGLQFFLGNILSILGSHLCVAKVCL